MASALASNKRLSIAQGADDRQIEHRHRIIEHADKITTIAQKLILSVFILHHPAAGKNPVDRGRFLRLHVANPRPGVGRLRLAVFVLPAQLDGHVVAVGNGRFLGLGVIVRRVSRLGPQQQHVRLDLLEERQLIRLAAGVDHDHRLVGPRPAGDQELQPVAGPARLAHEHDLLVLRIEPSGVLAELLQLLGIVDQRRAEIAGLGR